MFALFHGLKFRCLSPLIVVQTVNVTTVMIGMPHYNNSTPANYSLTVKSVIVALNISTPLPVGGLTRR